MFYTLPQQEDSSYMWYFVIFIAVAFIGTNLAPLAVIISSGVLALIPICVAIYFEKAEHDASDRRVMTSLAVKFFGWLAFSLCAGFAAKALLFPAGH